MESKAYNIVGSVKRLCRHCTALVKVKETEKKIVQLEKLHYALDNGEETYYMCEACKNVRPSWSLPISAF